MRCDVWGHGHLYFIMVICIFSNYYQLMFKMMDFEAACAHRARSRDRQFFGLSIVWLSLKYLNMRVKKM